MAEPQNIYRTACLEAPSYGDTTFSRHFKYKMNSFTKGGKIRSLLRVLLYILVFLLIAFTFTIIGMVIYPKLIGHCKKHIPSEQQQQANQINDHYISSLGQILSSMGICKDPYNDTLAERVQKNKSETESSFQNVDSNFLINDVCKCPDSSKKLNTVGNNIKQGNGTGHHMGDTCICNESKEIGDFERNKAGNESKGKTIKLLNDLEANPSQHIHDFNNVTSSKEEQYSSNPQVIGKCHCFNGTLNGSEFDREKLETEIADLNECICPETSEIQAFNDNEKINGSMQNAMQSLNAGEVHDIPNLHFNETEFINKSQKHVMESLNLGANDKAHLHFNETETLNENQSLMKEKCKCPKIQNMTYVLFNGTKLSDEMHDLGFKEDDVCECSDLRDNDKTSKTISETEAHGDTSLNTEECVCSEIPETANNESAIEGNKHGFKAMNGECVCAETLGIQNFNKTEITNVSGIHDTELFNSTETYQTTNLPFNETESINKNQYLKSNKCICPTPHNVSHNVSNETTDGFHDSDFSGDDGCICPSTEAEEINNFDLHETESESDKNDNKSLKVHECVCYEKPKSIGNASSIANNKLGFKTLNGECVCTETLDLSDIHANGQVTTNEKEFSLDDEKDSITVKELTNGHETEYVHEKGSNFGDEIGTVNVKALRNGSERDNENKEESSYDDEKDSSDTPLSFEAVTSTYDKFIAYEKGLTVDGEKEILNESEVTHHDND